MDKWIEIARTGTFTDSAGRQQTFTEKDLDAIASAYDPQNGMLRWYSATRRRMRPRRSAGRNA